MRDCETDLDTLGISIGTRRHVRTKAQPAQPLPLFSEVLALLMEPENIHVKLNVSEIRSQTLLLRTGQMTDAIKVLCID